MCIFPIMYSEINILMLNVNFVQDSRCILHNGKYDFAGDRAWRSMCVRVMGKYRDL